MDLTALKDALAGLTITLTALQASIAPLQAERPQPVEAIVREYFADAPIMAEIARCESGFRQHDEHGNVLKGKITPADTGVFQINLKAHPEAKGKVETLEGNLAYARKLYEAQGVRPWYSSIKCWHDEGGKAAVPQMAGGAVLAKGTKGD